MGKINHVNGIDFSWHTLPKDALLEALSATEQGLNDSAIRDKQALYGLNSLSEQQAVSKLKRFLLQFHNVLIYVLLGSATITAALGHFLDTAVIIAVVVANAIIGFIQEGKAENALAAIKHMLAPKANVLRNAQKSLIPAQHLVPGDVIYLEPGDKVPADCRLLSCFGLSVDESILTGESVPSKKDTKVSKEDSALGDRHCMLFSGTIIKAGQGVAIVVSIGEQTQIGRINHLLTSVEVLNTPLVNQMAVFAKWLTVFILAVASLLLAYGLLVEHYSFNYIFMAVVSLSVAAIPEGLPAIVTITLAIGVKAMAKRNAIIRRLPSIETIGAVSVICTDKTGTLTRNEMMVSSVITDKHIFTLEGEGYSPVGEFRLNEALIDVKEHLLLNEIAQASLLCNDASINQTGETWDVVGDPMEGALLSFSAKVGLDLSEENATWKRTDVIPFDAAHCYMATLNHNHEGESIIFVKGAPERILAMSRQQLGSDGNMGELDLQYWQNTADKIASGGQRVLAFGFIRMTDRSVVIERDDVEGHVQLLGMVGMIDPPRAEAVHAVKECHEAGIKVKMITGDHVGTALAIAQKIGLQNTEKALLGKDIDSLSDEQLQNAVLTTDVFARTSPEHKLRLVMALQAQDEIVAMTGDGVNDTPALKRADAGIAMGKKGSEAAKEASDLVLADDNFASIVAAIRQGRTVYDNIKKVISWSLPTSTGEAMIIIVALLMGLALPITPIQILWINLITTVTLGFALAFDRPEKTLMQRQPRNANAPLIDGYLIWHIIFVSGLFVSAVFAISYLSINQSYSAAHAQTLSLNTLVILEIFHLLFIRNIFNTGFSLDFLKGSPVLWLTVSLVLIAQVAVIYVPFLQGIFGTTGLAFKEWLMLIGLGILVFILLELEKQFRLFRHRAKGLCL